MKNLRSLRATVSSKLAELPYVLHRLKPTSEMPIKNMASVATKNDASTLASMLISTADSGSLPVNTAPKMAMMKMMVFGKTVLRAASTLPTPPWLIPIRSPSISTEMLNRWPSPKSRPWRAGAVK